MKYLITLMLCVSMSALCNSQTVDTDTLYRVTMLAQAQTMADALVKGDFKTYAKYVFPKLLAMGGGEESLIARMSSSMEQMNADAGGKAILKVTMDNPSEILLVGDELQCVLRQRMTLKTAKGKALSTANLIAISADKGQHWTFLDTNGSELKSLKGVFPNISEALTLPKPEKIQFLND